MSASPRDAPAEAPASARATASTAASAKSTPREAALASARSAEVVAASAKTTPREPPLPLPASPRVDSAPEEAIAPEVTEAIEVESPATEATATEAPPAEFSSAVEAQPHVGVEAAPIDALAAAEPLAIVAEPIIEAPVQAVVAAESVSVAAPELAPAEQPVAPEPEEPKIPPFTYDPLTHPELVRAPLDFSLPNHPFTQLHASIGYSSARRNNLHYLNDSVLIYAVGNTVVLFNVHTLEKQTLFGIGRGGIGAICVRFPHFLSHGTLPLSQSLFASLQRSLRSSTLCAQVHPTKEVFAVAEKGYNPNIFIYEYPALKVIRILRKGTERAFCDLEFEYVAVLLFVACVACASEKLKINARSQQNRRVARFCQQAHL